MNKKELATAVAKQTNLTIAEANKSIDAVFQSIKDEIVVGNSTTIKGFGCFSVSDCIERQGFNPRTKQRIKIAAHKVMRFKPSPSIKIK